MSKKSVLKKAFTATVCGMILYLLYGTLIQLIGNAFHVTWRVVPDATPLLSYKLYWLTMIEFWFIIFILYFRELFSNKKKWYSSRARIANKVLCVIMLIATARLWYTYIQTYQTKFLM